MTLGKRSSDGCLADPTNKPPPGTANCAQKIYAFGPFRISGAQLLFPITYIFGDIFTEVYG